MVQFGRPPDQAEAFTLDEVFDSVFDHYPERSN
jgi:hypothetical protein